MVLNISGLNIYLEQYLNKSGFLPEGQSSKKDVILIHGFTGSSKDWEQIIPGLSKNFNYYAIDLTGHGNSDSPTEKNIYEANALIEQLRELIKKISNEKITLLGYSMGGRVALSYAVKYPETIEGLILESTTAGIKDDNEREERLKKDEELADFIESPSM